MRVLLVVSGLLLVLAFPTGCVPDEALIKLPEPTLQGMTVEDAIRARRSIRSYSPDSLDPVEVSQLLFAAQGITGKRGSRLLRAAPSAGATYPIEVYVVVGRVRGLAPGIYHYLPREHALEVVRKGEYGDSLAAVCLGQTMPREAALSIVLTAIPERTTSVYGERGLRYIYMEAGHVSQNICLEATSLGLGAVPIGAFFDARLRRLLGIYDESEMSLYVNCIGRPAKRGDPK